MDIDERLDKTDKELQALVVTVLHYIDAYTKLAEMFYRLLAILLVSGKLDPEHVEDILSIAKEIDDE